ncbi:response regulator [Haloferula chungangensis]|uniref:Response regulator n=1 Tax=Haloferula chungangensis TaxID=1048331 RepID=A0ABW2L0B3_9BACT
MTSPIRIMLVEDNCEYRDVIHFALEDEPQMEILAQFTTAEMALGSLREDQSAIAPHIVLLDLRLPGMSGLQALPYFREKVPSAKIIILSQSDSEADVIQAITLGAAGYLLKSSSVQQLKGAIRSVIAGGASLDPTIARYLVDVIKSKPSTAVMDHLLTHREVEILELLADGLSKKEICDRLGIKYPTVDSHVRHIYEKLDVNNAPAAVRRAYRVGIFPPEV